MKNHRRTKTQKFDRLTAPDVEAEETRVHYALAPFDEAVRQADVTWGLDRLPGLVSPDTASKYGFSVGKLNEAIRANDAEAVKQWVGVCIRGLHVMNAEAEAAGKPKSRPDMLEYELDGFRFAVMPDSSYWPEIRKHRPDLVLFSLREVAIALIASRADNPVIRAAKEAFPKAEIFNLDTKVNKALAVEDEIPWM